MAELVPSTPIQKVVVGQDSEVNGFTSPIGCGRDQDKLDHISDLLSPSDAIQNDEEGHASATMAYLSIDADFDHDVPSHIATAPFPFPATHISADAHAMG
jgi:hypothetical protein